MNDDISEKNALLLCCAVAAVCLFFGYAVGSSEVRKEAVKHGMARWVAEESGAPKFGWGQ
jgi:hypothetical protein